MTEVRQTSWLLLVTLVVASSFVEFRIRQFPEHAYAVYIPKVVDGSAGAPGVYRVLAPYTHVWLVSASGLSNATVWHLSRLFWFTVAYLATYWYLRTWFAPGTAASGVLGLAAVLPLTYTNSWAHPDAIPELALFTLGCFTLVRGRDGWFAAVLVLAALNRETSAFLLVAYALARPLRTSHAGKTVVLGLLWAAIYVALRLVRGLEHYDYWQLPRNLGFLGLLPPGYDLYKRAYAWFIALLVGPAVVSISVRWREIPTPAKRLLMAGIPLVIAAFTASSIIETRIFIPLLPLGLPALMFALNVPKRVTEESPSAQ